MRLIFVKTNKNKKFEYKPRFYDPKKEEMEKSRTQSFGFKYQQKYKASLLAKSRNWTKNSI